MLNDGYIPGCIIGATSGVLNESVFVAEKVSISVFDDL